MPQSEHNVIEIKGLSNFLGGHWVHKDLDLTVSRGEIIGIIGASGCGKTTLLRTILMLRKPTSGSVKVFDTETVDCGDADADKIRARWGVMFQSGALFSSMCVLDNVIFPMAEYVSIPEAMKKQAALLKIALAGLELDAAVKFPAELSGGMQKRAALARAIALDPELLFLDEPTAGLDPKSAGELDELVLHMRDTLGLTFVMVTHDLDTLWHVPDRVVFMGEGKILAAEPMQQLIKHPHPLIQAYFKGPRSQWRIAQSQSQGGQDGA